MEMRGARTALEQAVAEARQRELQEPEQLGLFDDDEPAPASSSSSASSSNQVAPRGRGRPPGARNRRTDEAARHYMAEFGDPLRRGVMISAMPILAPGVLEGLAKVLGCERFDAAKWWSGIYSATMPFIHQKFSTLEVKPEGSPDGGQPVAWSFAHEELAERLIEAVAEPAEPQEIG